jgi:serine/threonine protein kinase
MTPEQHARIQEIFEAAIDLPAHARVAYLDSACGDAGLRARVDQLLDAVDETVTIDSSLDSPALTVRECPNCLRCFDDPIPACPFDGSGLANSFAGSLLIDGKYRIERRLGSGGMGSVYLALHVSLEKYFAVKLINIDGPVPVQYRERFENEARALGRLKHPNIVDVTDYGIDSRGGGLPYLVMEYLEGGTVRQRMRRGENTPFLETLPLLHQLAAGIDAAHAKGIVHGDLKPANLLAGTGVVKIVDFGLARLGSTEGTARSDLAADTSRTGSGTIRGTPAYMAPELFRGEEATRASDRFAFGVIAYELLTGTLPFGREALEVRKQVQQPAAAPSATSSLIPPELDSPVMRLLAAGPDDRPSSATAAVEAMEAAWIAAEQRKWREREVPRRLAISALAAMVIVSVAAGSTQSRFVRILEERTADWRFGMLPKRSPDRRLLVVSLDDQTLAADSRPLAAMDADFGEMIDGLFEAGARGVAVDILLPNWSQSARFAKAVATHADRMALAKFSSASGVIGPECIGPLTALVLGPLRYDALFGFVNLETDEDGQIRRARTSFLDGEGQTSPSFAARAAETAGLVDRAATSSLWIDYTVRARNIPLMSWSLASTRLRERAPVFAGKLVILGASYAGSGDFHRVPNQETGLVPGAVIQALTANTMIEKFTVSQLGIAKGMLLAGIASLGTIALALRYPNRPQMARVSIAILILGYLLFGFLALRLRLLLIPMAGPEIALFLAAIVAWQLPLRLSPYPTALPASGTQEVSI